MKTTLLGGAVAFSLAVAALAQSPVDPSVPARAIDKIPLMAIKSGESIVMVGGALILLSTAGDVSRVEAEMILPNGTRILPNGNVVARDGKNSRLVNGQMIMPTGEIMAAPSTLFGSDKPKAPMPQ